MNFINVIFLRLVLLPKTLYKKMGIDPRQLRLILTTKLIMDDRRPNTFHHTRVKKTGTEISTATLGTMLFSVLIGLVFLLSFSVSDKLVTQLTLYFSFYIFMLATTLISDFTSVLIDVRDNLIILPKPVTARTFVMSRLLHILIHVTKIIMPMSLPGIAYMFITRNLWAATSLFLVITFVTTFTIFLINAVYLLILRITSPRKFQSIISYVQIFMAVFMYASYQVLPRLASRIQISDYDLAGRTWVWFLPSYWFASGWQFFNTFSLEIPVVCGGVLTLLVPPVSLWMVIKYFAPSFNQKLSLISGTGKESSSMAGAASRARGTLASWLSSILTTKGEERMGFLLTWKLTGRSRDFKLKVYPSIGYLLVYLFMMLFNYHGGLASFQSNTGRTRLIIIGVIYMSSFLLVMAINQMQYSDKFRAAWFFFTSPVKRPGLIITGSLKAAAVKFFTPTAFLIVIAGILIVGPKLIPNLLLGLSNVLFGSIILSLVSLRNLPFSAAQNTNEKAGAFMRGLLSLVVPLFLGLLHYILYNFFWAVAISLCLSLLANWWLFNVVKNRSWRQVILSYQEG